MHQYKNKNYVFKNVWFNEQRNDSQCMEYLSKLNPKILEIGSYCGASSCYWIENLDPSVFYCVDTWEGSQEHSEISFSQIENQFDFNIKQALKNTPNCKFTKIKNSSFDAIPMMTKDFSNYFDFIYVDGSHTAFHTLIDIINSFKLLAVNGILAIDDYKWTCNKGPLNDPALGIDAFLSIFSSFVQIYTKGYQVWLKKIKCPYTTYIV